MAYQTWKDAYKQVVLDEAKVSYKIDHINSVGDIEKELKRGDAKIVNTKSTRDGVIVQFDVPSRRAHAELKKLVMKHDKDAVMEGKTDMTAISSWKKKLKDVKGLTKQQIQMLSTLPTPVITSLINQVGMIVADMSEDISEGKRTDGATSFMFKNGPDSKKFLAYAKDFRKAERWTMNGLFFVDVYDVNKPVAIKLAKFHRQFWKEDVNEGMNMKQIMRKHGRELKKAVRTGNLELSDKAEEDLQQWVFDNEPYVGDDPDDFDQWLDDNIEDIVKGRIKEVNEGMVDIEKARQLPDKIQKQIIALKKEYDRTWDGVFVPMGKEGSSQRKEYERRGALFKAASKKYKDFLKKHKVANFK